MAVIPSPEIWHRDDFPLLCNWRMLWRAVEVGVDRGEFSNVFLSRWQGYAFYGVDPYKLFRDIPDCREADFQMAAIRYERHARIARLLRCESLTFAKRIQELQSDKDYLGFFQATPKEHKDAYVDFVYLDGSHDYKDVMQDIRAWWPLLSGKGIIAGHDFDNRWGVEQAVREMFAKGGIDDKDHQVFLTADWPQSWYVYRNGMPGPGWSRHPE